MLKHTANRLSRRADWKTFRSVLAWLCVALILVTGSVHLLHQHPAGDDAASATCGLCALAHVAVVHVPVQQHQAVQQAFTSFELPPNQAPPPRFLHPSLYVRPPPALMPVA